MPDLNLSIGNFRVLDRIEWQMRERQICLLVGADGTGKSTTLDALRFLREMFLRGYQSAFNAVGGTAAFATRGSKPDTSVCFSVQAGNIHWDIRIQISARRVTGHYEEHLYRLDHATDSALEGMTHKPGETECNAKRLWDYGDVPWMKPLANLLEHTRIYEPYWLNEVKRGKANASDTFLHGTGRNLWAVLANWRASPLRYNHRFEWILKWARQAFPGLIDDIEFDCGVPSLFPLGVDDPEDGLTPSRMGDGLLTGLLHLTATAGTPDGGLLAIDEIENHMHPHAIRTIIAAMRQQAEQRDLTIILTTHSPVVLNQFYEEPGQVYVLPNCRSDLKKIPVQLTELHNVTWLAQEELGSLYERLAFAGPAFGAAS